MGNVFIEKSDNVFDVSKKFLEQNKLKYNYDFLIIDFHGEITSRKWRLVIFLMAKLL